MTETEIRKIVQQAVRNATTSPLPEDFEGREFHEIGVDSLSTVELVLECMQQTSIKIPFDQRGRVRCANDVVALLLKCK